MRARRVLLCFAVLAAAACGGSDAPAPITAATPPPMPTPEPSAPPVATFSCPLPALPDLHNTCPKLQPQLWQIVENAIQKTIQEHPELFDFNDGYGQLSWRVLNRKKYYDLVKYNLERMGYCAAHDEEEIGVKNDNRFNEQYQIMTSYGYSRWGAGAYRATCWPPWF